MAKSSEELARGVSPAEPDGTSERRPPATGSCSGESSLTNRENQILRFLANGLSTDAIAADLRISRVTVRNHVQRILQKLGAHTRLEALAAAYRSGLLAPPARERGPVSGPLTPDEDSSLT